MSDTEDDSELLDEIRALEDILAKDECSTSPNVRKDVSTPNLASRRTSVPSRGFGEVTPHRVAVNVVDDSRTAYETNKMLIELLQETKIELLAILEKCIENKAAVTEKIRVTASNNRSSKVFIATAGMPYFKTSRNFSAPCNNDAMTKARKGELQLVQLRYTCPWTAKDRNILWKAIRQEASAAVLDTEREDRVSLPGASDDPCFGRSGSLNLPKNFKAMIGPLDDREFDWMKIAASDFESRHTSDECRVMWRVFLHPDINRYRWTKDEDSKIVILSEKYKRQDWETLAKELGTQRSGYQCFIRYNTNNRSMSAYERPWTDEEDARLAVCINRFKIGNYVPWGAVAIYMNGRNKSQVYFRWTYNAAPHLKKGRFTKEEDAILTEAVAKYGKNFSRISEHVMPERSSAQLNDHYMRLVQRKKGVRQSWSIDEDARLLRLFGEHGPNWSGIAMEFPGRNRTQVRHRHASIIRYWDKGVSLFDIPREYGRVDDEPVGDTEVIDRLERQRMQQLTAMKRSKMQRVDVELAKFFELPPPASRSGRKAKYYREHELERVTRNLYVLLKTLNAVLVIPDKPNHRILTEKDKQLLKSLDCLHSESESPERPTTDVECAGRNVPGTRMVEDDGERHFAPLCSGNCNRMVKTRLNDSIDYQDKRQFDDCRIKLDMECHTPTDVSEIVGEEENYEFDKLMRIFQTQHVLSRERDFRQIYASRPREFSTNSSDVAAESLPHDSRSHKRGQQEKSSPRRSKRQVTLWDCTISEGIIHDRDRFTSCIEPNYHTLLGLQHIISRKMGEKSSSNSRTLGSETTISERGAKSLDTLKRRLVQLFKYPIGLSHILRPETYAENILRDTPSDNGTRLVEDNVEEIPVASSSEIKRKRFKAAIKMPISSKNNRVGRGGKG